MSDQKSWEQALDRLQHQMTRATFDTWLRGTRLVDAQGDTWTIGVHHGYAIDWLGGRLRPLVEEAASRVAGHPVTLEFRVHVPARSEPEPDLDDEDHGPEEILEAVREEHVSVTAGGHSLTWTDFYIKFKVAFRKRALRELKGAKLSVFLCLALHVDRDGVAHPGIETIMRETGYSRPAVCSALDSLEELGLVAKRDAVYMGPDEYVVNGYAWFGQNPAPALWEVHSEKS